MGGSDFAINAAITKMSTELYLNQKHEVDMTNKYTILDVLNSYCWSHIFSYLSTEDLIRSERVSIQWRDLVIEYFKSNRKRTLKTSWFPRITLNELVLLLKQRGAAFTRLVYDEPLSTDHYSQVNFDSNICPNLENLVIYTHDKKCHLRQLLRFKAIKSIVILSSGRFDIADQVFIQPFISDHFRLEKLALIWDRSTGQFLTDNINKFQNIKSLDFSNCNNLTEKHLESIKRLYNLTTLRMNRCRLILPIILKLLRSLTQLQELSLNSYDSTFDYHRMSMQREFCNTLSKLHLLRHLKLFSNSFVTDDVLKQIAQSCDCLESLDISNCKDVSDEGVIAVCSSCKNLQVLNVSNLVKLSSLGVEAVSQAVRLVRLEANSLQALNLTAAFAACLRKCTILSSLNAIACDVTSELLEAAVDALALHPRPLVLNLTRTQVTCTDELPKHRHLTVIFKS